MQTISLPVLEAGEYPAASGITSPTPTKATVPFWGGWARHPAGVHRHQSQYRTARCTGPHLGKSVERLAAANGFDSWIMFNVYPQRATDPNDMDKSTRPRLCDEKPALAAGRSGTDRAHHVGGRGHP